MSASISLAKILPINGILRTARNVIAARRTDVRGFLVRNTGPDILVKECVISRGALQLKVTLPNGESTRSIFISSDSGKATVAIRQEDAENGGKIKMMYAWKNPLLIGEPENADATCILSNRTKRGKWHILEKPIRLGGMSEAQQKNQEYPELVNAVTQGLGARVMTRWWNVLAQKAQGIVINGLVEYKYGGRMITISGFKNYSKVFTRLVEENDKIMAYFYADEGMAVLVKAAVLSERKLVGEHPEWQVLECPEVTFASIEDSPVQYRRMICRMRHDFLLNDELNPGDFIEVEPLPVKNTGSVSLHLRRDSVNEIGAICLTGYLAFAGKKLAGRIIVKGDEKRVYFWENEKARATGKEPIKPEGQLLAVRRTDLWEIIWERLPVKIKDKRKASARYGNFLHATVVNKVHLGTWSVYTSSNGGNIRKRATMQIRGNKIQSDLPPDYPFETIFARTTELGQMIKLVEFWPKREDFARGKEPGYLKFISIHIKSSDNPWRLFWAELDDLDAFKSLDQKKMLDRTTLANALSSSFLVDKYPDKIYPIIDYFEMF